MRGKSLALLVLALGCGLVASIGITQVMSKRNAQDGGASGDTETILVAVEDIALGEPLQAELLRAEPWPKDKVPAGALTNVEEAEGRITRTMLYAGEPIRETKLYKEGEGGSISNRIPKGFRAVSVKVDSVMSNGNLLRPGDSVDVLVHLRRNPPMEVMETSTRTILQNVKVFAVNDVVEPSAEGGDQTIRAKTVSLLVTLENAEKIMLATQLGAINLVMRSPEDDERVETDGTASTELTGGRSELVGRPYEDPRPSGQTPDRGGDGFLQYLQGMKTAAAAKQAEQQGDAPDESNSFQVRGLVGSEMKVFVLNSPQGNLSATAVEGGAWSVSPLGTGPVLDRGSDALPPAEPDADVDREEDEPNEADESSKEDEETSDDV